MVLSAEDLQTAADLVESRNPLPAMLTVSQTASLLQVSRSTIWRWIDAGTLHASKIPGSRTTRIPRTEIDRVMTEGRLS